MNYKFLRQYMSLCACYGWAPSWEGLDKYVKTLEWRKKYIGGGCSE